MQQRTISCIFSKTALLMAMLAATGCTQVENAYNGIMGDDSAPQSAKMGVKSPAAAPYQDVKTQDNSKTTPVELGAVSESATPPAATAAPVAANATALLTIRFNQPRVYYEDALGQAVAAAEKTKTNVVYDVLSTVPDLSSLAPEQQQKLSGRAKDNLKNVVTKIQQMGVPADRIRIADQTLKIRSQEVQIFVR